MVSFRRVKYVMDKIGQVLGRKNISKTRSKVFAKIYGSRSKIGSIRNEGLHAYFRLSKLIGIQLIMVILKKERKNENASIVGNFVYKKEDRTKLITKLGFSLAQQQKRKRQNKQKKKKKIQSRLQSSPTE